MPRNDTPAPNQPLVGKFPNTRLRRTRRFDWSRRLVQEKTLTPSDLIWGLFLIEGKSVREPIPSLPGIFRLSPDEAVKEAKRAYDLGIPVIALFPYTEKKHRTADGRESLNPDNLVCRTAKMIKMAVPDIGLMGDIALDPYTDHGHDGILIDGDIHNDETIKVLVEQSLVQAGAGFDILAPSDMMDGRVGAMRRALEESDFFNTQIMAYSAKYASAFYGPFRDAIGSSGVLQGDKRTYQMDPSNGDEAMHEIAMDLEEGADMIMVKPGMPYLDLVRRAKETFSKPTIVYQVSGEYAMIMAAAQNGWLDEEAVIMESLMAFKRAGADGIITYFADRAAKILSS